MKAAKQAKAGEASAAKGPVRHSEETKAAILAHLIAGSTIRATAEAVGVPPTTVHRIATENAEQIGTEKGTQLGDRILSLLEEIVEGNLATARLLQDPVWIRQQKPNDLASLAGTHMDKAFRIMIAMERGRRSNLAGERSPLPVPDVGLAEKEDLKAEDLKDQALEDLAAGLFSEEGERQKGQASVATDARVVIYKLPENGREAKA